MRDRSICAVCLMAWAGLWLLDGRAGARGSEEEAAGYRRMIETDWAAQEARLGRELSAPKAVQEAFARAERLRVRLRRIPGVASLQAEEDGLDGLRCRVDKVETLAVAEPRDAVPGGPLDRSFPGAQESAGESPTARVSRAAAVHHADAS